MTISATSHHKKRFYPQKVDEFINLWKAIKWKDVQCDDTTGHFPQNHFNSGRCYGNGAFCKYDYECCSQHCLHASYCAPAGYTTK
ncbi:hypothetical protein PPL_05903 [Heterostelium album PN500]|uniref:Uncharacterized protein n=1 Tax=Heterostelium pallidum (strain ATCC 26659 / Pp 5 / PN500) TaxID=670386 RepID=D3BBN4_HETP5|nr:hypothetical protein PPL_05903 [Heterostelium album PN500]EFA81067.1 hypothetical protein PPL_05903 [Heterostelium album PN500]|eukprot:XP_020433185.1 hypothetical protein PPL_05903 [Heterostelium album PN500]